MEAPGHGGDGAGGRDKAGGEKRGRAPRRLSWIVIAIGVALLALLAFGLLRHRHRQKAVEASAREERQALPVVNVTKVRRSPGSTTLLLPGNMTPLTEAYLYARANGYVSKRLADIGDRVKKNQLLAVIEAPDLDQQVEQARASLAQAEHQVSQAQQQVENARSQEELARVTQERYKVLLEHGAVARQDADQVFTTYRSAVATTAAAQANVSAAQQNVQANRANLDRLIALQSFEYVRAPFSGVITARNFDIGALVGGSGGTQGASSTPQGGTQISGASGNAGANGTAPSSNAPVGAGTPAAGGAGELFRIAQIDRLRILVNVPQDATPSIRAGEAAKVLVQNFAGKPFEGRLTRTANSIDLTTRTLLAEVDVANPRGLLLPGMYAQVELTSDRANPPLLIPGDSIITEASGLEVAVLGEIAEKPGEKQRYPPDARQIRLRSVQVGRDYGAQIEIVSGLEDGEVVAVNPSDVIQEGAIVRPQFAPPAQTNTPRNGQSGRPSGNLTQPTPGEADSNGRGASTKKPGGGGGKTGNKNQTGGQSR